MQEPKMRALSIELSGGTKRYIEIEALTDEAVSWMHEHTAKFGTLSPSTSTRHLFFLNVYRGYNRQEVLDYLHAQWDAQQWPEELPSGAECARSDS